MHTVLQDTSHLSLRTGVKLLTHFGLTGEGSSQVELGLHDVMPTHLYPEGRSQGCRLFFTWLQGITKVACNAVLVGETRRYCAPYIELMLQPVTDESRRSKVAAAFNRTSEFLISTINKIPQATTAGNTQGHESGLGTVHYAAGGTLQTSGNAEGTGTDRNSQQAPQQAGVDFVPETNLDAFGGDNTQAAVQSSLLLPGTQIETQNSA